MTEPQHIAVREAAAAGSNVVRLLHPDPGAGARAAISSFAMKQARKAAGRPAFATGERDDAA